MNRQKRCCHMYTAGISQDSVEAIKANCGIDAAFYDMGEDINESTQLNSISSGITWISLDAWKNLPSAKKEKLDSVPKILVLPENILPEDIDAVGAVGFSAMLREPMQPKSIQEAVFQAIESHNIYQDIYRMTREILLERELLGRKNANLYFLVNFLSATSGLLLPNEILISAREHLSELLPLEDVGAFLWGNKEPITNENAPVPAMFIPATKSSYAWNKWHDALTSAAKSLGHSAHNEYDTFSLPAHLNKTATPQTSQDLNLALPLRIKDKSVGVIIVSLAEDYSLGADNIEVLDSAMTHLALALRSTWLYKQVKNKAERDGLTGLYNRRYLDERLLNEIKRHDRYGNELAIIMLDIDHFKSINDSYGHVKGDDVLRELAPLLGEDLRHADCLARYGGEEFLILLPHTSADQAWALAERLRQKISKHQFCKGEICRQVTVSLGVAAFKPKSGLNMEQLLTLADIGLYRAKKQGRNATVLETWTGPATQHLDTNLQDLAG